MVNKVVPSFLLMAAVVGVVLVVVGLLLSDSVGADGHSSTRSFSPSQIAPSGEVSVRIAVNNYGQFGGVAETIPADFTYVAGSSNVDVVVDGRTLEFALYGEAAVTYRVTASDTAGSYVFSGDLIDDQGNRRSIGGVTSFTVTPVTPLTPRPGPTVLRSFSPSQIAPSGEVSVRITVNNYGQFGGVAETIPADFTYVAGSSNLDVVVDGRTLEFALYGEAAVTYRVTASDTAGSYVFSGDLIDDQGNRHSIGGVTSFTVTPRPGPTVLRSFSPSQIAPSGEVSVRIAVNNYGQFGGVAETIPADFTYVAGSSNLDVVVDGRTLEFALYGEAAVTYRVTASDTAGSYVFSGDLIDDQGNRHSIGGSSRVTVRVVAPEPDPQENRPPAFTEGSATTRTVAENTEAGMDVGGPVRATDRDGDTLAYSLTGIDAGSFAINSSGQIMVGTGTMLDFEDKASYMVTVRATDPDNASDTISVTVTVGNVEEQGTVTLNPDRPLVGTALTASLTDPDGGVTGETWRWSRSDAADGTFTGIRGATRASYTPVEADEGMYLKITVTYTDGHGPNKTATASAMVPPPSNSPPRFSETAPTRSIAENSAAGTAVGAPVRATDPDGDSLTYTLGGSDAATFSIGRTSGQLMARAALDYETKPSYSVGVTARDNRGGSDTTTVAVAVTNVEEQGTVTLNPDRPLVGTALTASLTDPDGGVTGETWRWSRSDAADGTFTGIGGATRASYTPVEADDGMYLKITVTYTDGHGPNKTATAGAMVSDPLIARYDANKDGTIEIRELFNAIDHYFDGTIELSELFKVIDYYFDG